MGKIYKCGDCGDILEVLAPESATCTCCEGGMEALEEKTQDEGMEKHVPVVEKTDKGVNVKVGSVAHPMEAEHFIQWIEIIADGRSYRKFLNPGDAPEAEFEIQAENIAAREYCNLHGLWKG